MKDYKQQQKHKYWCFNGYRIDEMEQAMSHKIIAMYQEDEYSKKLANYHSIVKILFDQIIK